MLASRLTALLPEMTDLEAIETASVTSLVQNELNFHNWKQRPFRAPHHSASLPALVGGEPFQNQAKYHSHITAYFFLMNCLSLSEKCLMHFDSP